MGNDIGGPISGRADASGGYFAGSPRAVVTGGVPVKASTDGTDSTPVITETYLVELPVKQAVRSTGFANFNGSVASGNLKAYLYNKDGKVIASTASTAMSGTDAFQRIPWSAPINLQPGVYYVGLQVDNTTARFNTHPFGNFGASKKTGEVYGTGTTITPPTTFTAGQGPMGGLY
jgi:surface antigen